MQKKHHQRKHWEVFAMSYTTINDRIFILLFASKIRSWVSSPYFSRSACNADVFMYFQYSMHNIQWKQTSYFQHSKVVSILYVLYPAQGWYYALQRKIWQRKVSQSPKRLHLISPHIVGSLLSHFAQVTAQEISLSAKLFTCNITGRHMYICIYVDIYIHRCKYICI